MKVGRNAPCACGSGSKFKKCCGTRDATLEFPKGMVGYSVDEKRGRTYIFTEGTILNQLRRDAPKIAISFDKICVGQLTDTDRMAARTLGILSTYLMPADEDDDTVRNISAKIVLNSMNTLTAAIAILRDGYTLQPGMLVRNILESLTTVLCIFSDAGDLAAFKLDRLKPESKIGTANKVLPIFGALYGMFSDGFTHVRGSHGHLHPVLEYKEIDEALKVNLQFVRIAMWLIYVVTELVFLDVIAPKGMYWKKIAPGTFSYEPDPEGKKWMNRLLGEEATGLGA